MKMRNLLITASTFWSCAALANPVLKVNDLTFQSVSAEEGNEPNRQCSPFQFSFEFNIPYEGRVISSKMKLHKWRNRFFVG